MLQNKRTQLVCSGLAYVLILSSPGLLPGAVPTLPAIMWPYEATNCGRPDAGMARMTCGVGYESIRGGHGGVGHAHDLGHALLHQAQGAAHAVLSARCSR
jgi:hypothetical protein